MIPRAHLPRRRAIAIAAAFAGVPWLSTDQRRTAPAPLFEWRGTSLGSPSRLLLCHPSRAAAEQVVARCVAEIERLERAFALYRDSEIACLNRDGRLAMPSHDLLVVLSECQHLSALSGGAFDVTVQPLWETYASHFFGPRSASSPTSEGPDPRVVAAALKLVDWRSLEFTSRSVAFARPGTRLTLNGIAQGYVADRVTTILRDNGFDRILADLGRSEIYASGQRPDGQAWRIGLANPRNPETLSLRVDLIDSALCTSGGYGTKFEKTGRYHHLFDPRTGDSANQYIAVSVFAPSAMIADGLSTALYVTPRKRGRDLLANFRGATAIATLPDGSTQYLSG